MERDYYLATAQTADIAASILGEAFSDDPISNWVSTKDEYHKFIFSMLMPFYLAHGEVWISQNNDAAIMCLKPGVTKEFSPSPLLIATFLWKFGPGSLSRILHLSNVFKKYHHHGPHYYLLALGTTKKARGSGAGGGIVRFLIERADAQGVAIYAENSNPKNNRGFYRNMGFTIGDEISIRKDAPSFDLISYLRC
jgi:ribosomal protein S18 acetylase RimI-like enzyme